MKNEYTNSAETQASTERWELECLGHQLRIVTNKNPGDEFGDDIAGLGQVTELALARGKLMVAAPDLLKQLGIACRKLQSIGLEYQIPEIPELAEIRAAIAKAA
jgi:hypothetical protein